MQQRVVIAMALAKDPTLLVLDEPTTGLDATVEAEVLDLVAARQEFGTSVLFISHNLGVITRMCDRVGVLYAGRLVEEGPVDAVFDDPRHPYAVGLPRCIPRGGVRKDRVDGSTLIPGFPPPLGADLPACVYGPLRPAQEVCGKEEPASPRPRVRAPRPPLLGTRARASRRAAHPGPEPRSIRGAPGRKRREPAQDVQAGGERDPRRGGDRARFAPGETLGLVGESGSGKTTPRGCSSA